MEPVSLMPVLLQTPSFASCREQASGWGPSGSLSLPAHRSVLLGSRLAPGEEGQFFSAWRSLVMKPSSGEAEEAGKTGHEGEKQNNNSKNKNKNKTVFWKKDILAAEMKRKLDFQR